MPIVSSKTIPEGHLQADGKRYVKHVFTFDNGAVHEVLNNKVPGNMDETGYAALRANMIPAIEESYKQLEADETLNQFKQGKNPLRDPQDNAVTPNYQSRGELLKRVFDFIFSLSVEELIAYKQALPYLTNVTQPEIEALGYSWVNYQAWVNSVTVFTNAANNVGVV